jgi:hypothetical protein
LLSRQRGQVGHCVDPFERVNPTCRSVAVPRHILRPLRRSGQHRNLVALAKPVFLEQRSQQPSASRDEHLHLFDGCRRINQPYSKPLISPINAGYQRMSSAVLPIIGVSRSA